MRKSACKVIWVLMALVCFLTGGFAVRAERGAQSVFAGFAAEEEPLLSEERIDGNAEMVAAGNFSSSAGHGYEAVYVGGMPLTLSLKNRGLVIIGRIDVITKYGMVSTVKNSDIINGDTLLSVEGVEINSSEELSEVINREEFAGKVLHVQLRRKGETIETTLEPALDISSEKYKAGLLVREDTFGIGTLTYITPDLKFGSLGHAVYDPDVENVMEISGGSVYKCKISDVLKGERGRPGELKGGIDRTDGVIGSIYANNKFGVYGNLKEKMLNPLFPEPVEVCPQKNVKPGKAQILTTLEGGDPELYDIEIVKCSGQKTPNDRSMVLKVTDKRLIERAGGIVQGMSGSPILQKGKLVGSVTHVFINDPLRGYGLYIDWMLQN